MVGPPVFGICDPTKAPSGDEFYRFVVSKEVYEHRSVSAEAIYPIKHFIRL